MVHGVFSVGQRRAQVDGVQGVSFGLDTAVVSRLACASVDTLRTDAGVEAALYTTLVVVCRDLQYSSGPSVSTMDVANVTVRRMADWEAVKAERDTQLRQIARAGNHGVYGRLGRSVLIVLK